MQHSLSRISVSALAILLVVCAASCSSNKSDATAKPADGSSAADPVAGDALAEALARMDPADRDAARRQGVCPVSDEKLGSMGAPIKVSIEGQDVFLCCEGCSEDLRKDPQKFLAKLKK